MHLKCIFAVIVCIGVLSGSTQAQPPEPLRRLLAPEPDAPTRGLTAREAVDVYFSVGYRLDLDKMVEFKSLAFKEAFVKEYESKLHVLRLALRHRFNRPPGLTPAIMQPHHSNFRVVARLLAMEGEVRESKGDIGGAVNSYLDAVRVIQFSGEVERL